jgi:hypothetical protein
VPLPAAGAHQGAALAPPAGQQHPVGAGLGRLRAGRGSPGGATGRAPRRAEPVTTWTLGRACARPRGTGSPAVRRRSRRSRHATALGTVPTANPTPPARRARSRITSRAWWRGLRRSFSGRAGLVEDHRKSETIQAAPSRATLPDDHASDPAPSLEPPAVLEPWSTGPLAGPRPGRRPRRPPRPRPGEAGSGTTSRTSRSPARQSWVSSASRAATSSPGSGRHRNDPCHRRRRRAARGQRRRRAPRQCRGGEDPGPGPRTGADRTRREPARGAGRTLHLDGPGRQGMTDHVGRAGHRSGRPPTAAVRARPRVPTRAHRATRRTGSSRSRRTSVRSADLDDEPADHPAGEHDLHPLADGPARDRRGSGSRRAGRGGAARPRRPPAPPGAAPPSSPPTAGRPDRANRRPQPGRHRTARAARRPDRCAPR